MDKLKLIMEHTRMYQRVDIRRFHPLKEVAHQTWHLVGWWSHVQQLLTIEYANSFLAVMSLIIFIGYKFSN
jgi:hypothetical protein